MKYPAVGFLLLVFYVYVCVRIITVFSFLVWSEYTMEP